MASKIILPPVVRVRRNRIFWVREDKEALGEKDSNMSNLRTSLRSFRRGIEGLNFKRPL